MACLTLLTIEEKPKAESRSRKYPIIFHINSGLSMIRIYKIFKDFFVIIAIRLVVPSAPSPDFYLCMKIYKKKNKLAITLKAEEHILDLRGISTISINNKDELRNAFLNCSNSNLWIRTLKRGTWKIGKASTYITDHPKLKSRFWLPLPETHLSSPKELSSNLATFPLFSTTGQSYSFFYLHSDTVLNMQWDGAI